MYGNTLYLDPIKQANRVSYRLKKKENCDQVIRLSHPGYRYSDNRVSDQILAKESEHVDIITGGHTHTFMSKPEVLKNKIGENVIVNQVGWAGLVLGRLDIKFFEEKQKKFGRIGNYNY